MPESFIGLLTDPQTFPSGLVYAFHWISRTVVFPWLLAYLFVKATISFSYRYNVLARPSERGSHSHPTPRLGGLGSAAAFYVTSLLLAYWTRVPISPWHLALLIGGAWALVGGALDDFLELPPRWKLLLQLGACGSVVALRFAPSELQLPFLGTIALSPVIGSIIAVLFTFFMMNIFNFMDGMDGHAAGFGIVTGLGLGAYLGNFGFSHGFGGGSWHRTIEAASAAMLGGSLIGLLIYNYPGRSLSHKTFMGDCGSQFYGFTLAIVALQSGEGNLPGRFPLIAALILFSPFIYDVCFTLVQRVRRKEDLTQAHRSHLYQRLMVAGWSHGRTLAFNLLLWLGAVLLAWLYAAGSGVGSVITQLLALVGTAGLLAGYTLSVMQIEEQAAVRKIAR